jgi:hypothetical protein
MERSGFICVKRVKGKGRAVFAQKPIKAGQTIEAAPILRVPLTSLVDGMNCPELSRFFFVWDDGHVAIALGFGSLYNHSYQPNAHYEHGNMMISYHALRDIPAGEEITINYNGDPEDRDHVGFDVLEHRQEVFRNGQNSRNGHVFRNGQVPRAGKKMKTSRTPRRTSKR